VTLLVAALALTACSGASAPPADPARMTAIAAARHFLDTYVDPDGRVVRRDQGGDTVSEGQGYALLLAVAAGDRPRFDAVWGWTKHHLVRPDGLLSYLWRAGAVADPMPAADADTQVAWALVLGAARFAEPDLVAAGRRIAGAAADAEIGYDATGGPLLVAGPFGKGAGGRPNVAEPGYWAGPAIAALARLTGDRRWQDMQANHVRLLRALTSAGARLPADWVRVGAGLPEPIPAPAGGASVRCALDGQRALVWAALDPPATDLARRWDGLLGPDPAAAPLARALDGNALQSDATPLGAVAAAATARAAGRSQDVDRLLGRAAALDARFPSYYGGAWAALGQILLRTDLLSPSP